MYIPSDNKYHQAKHIFIAEVVVLFYYEFERDRERENRVSYNGVCLDKNNFTGSVFSLSSS